METSQREEATLTGLLGGPPGPLLWEGRGTPDDSLVALPRQRMTKVAGGRVAPAIAPPDARGWENQKILLCPFLSPKASLILYSGQGQDTLATVLGSSPHCFPTHTRAHTHARTHARTRTDTQRDKDPTSTLPHCNWTSPLSENTNHRSSSCDYN